MSILQRMRNTSIDDSKLLTQKLTATQKLTSKISTQDRTHAQNRNSKDTETKSTCN